MSKKLDRGGGRDRFRRDHPSRYEDSKGNGVSGRDNRSNNPPSRHLWVGNLSHSIVEEELAHPFLRFGPLENVAFQSGRSYAFVNFRRDEDAIDAMRALQGFTLAGNPLRIEFAKAVLYSTITTTIVATASINTAIITIAMNDTANAITIHARHCLQIK
ncbi:negative growth regulatory protein NGR1-like isoform X2 [Vigna umbellata]|uniref:negative growth regulatory protein NGR1-like isoform X2 n=1 Tax=Vigna umbellata TaxID=87088 RepID=UPI001F5F6485|nr:negative growth regulatory protein NGR1-like isoform X2 [Vigna umbellata]